MTKISKDILKLVYPPRPSESHKYDFGLLLVAGGGEFYTGSPALSAMAGFRAGVDMVYVAAPKRAADIIAGFSPNIAAFPLKGERFNEKNLPCLLSLAKSARAVAGKKTAIVLGGGMGRSRETKKAMRDYLRESELAAVVDADAIHAVVGDKQVVQGKNFIFTPHVYEFFVLTGRDIKELAFEERAMAVQEEAAKLGCIIVLKGARDIVSNGKETFFNETGSPYMTVGGTGDTLAGLCGAFLAMGYTPFLAAQAAVYINGKAGELASKKFGAGMLATDLIDFIAEAIK